MAWLAAEGWGSGAEALRVSEVGDGEGSGVLVEELLGEDEFDRYQQRSSTENTNRLIVEEVPPPWTYRLLTTGLHVQDTGRQKVHYDF